MSIFDTYWKKLRRNRRHYCTLFYQKNQQNPSEQQYCYENHLQTNDSVLYLIENWFQIKEEFHKFCQTIITQQQKFQQAVENFQI